LQHNRLSHRVALGGGEGDVRRVSPSPLLSVEALRVVMFVTGYEECSHACSSGMAGKKIIMYTT